MGIFCQTAPGQQHIGRADGSGIEECHAFVIVMILFQIRSVNDAEDVLLMGKKVFRDFYGRNLFQLVREVAGVPDVVRLLQSMGNNLLMLRVVFPEVGAAGALCTAGVSYIEHIPEPGSIPGLVNEGDPFCALSNVASHAFVPQVVFRACGSIWSLGVDHELFMVWVLVQAGGRGKKVCPTLEAGGYLGRHIVRQLVVVL